MKSTGLGGYLSLINSNSPKTHQNFSFSDTECQNEASSDSSDTEADTEASEAEQPPTQKSKSKVIFFGQNLGRFWSRLQGLGLV